MNMPAQGAKSGARRVVEASAWMTHLTEIGQESTPAFEAWLAAHEGNRQTWRLVRESWEFIGEQATSPELLDLRRKALDAARSIGRERWSGTSWLGRFRPALLAAGLAVLVCAVLAIWNFESNVYRTAAGVRRVVRLTDGSQVELDALTEMTVSYSEHARNIRLLKGQARFEVAPDVVRPFTVSAADQTVIALGTSFNVDLLESDLYITLIEGKVTVVPLQDGPESGAPSAVRGTELAPGQQLTVSAHRARGVTTANIQRITAWASGQMIVDDEPLSTVVRRINRYATKPLRVSDDAADLRLSGVFNTSDIEGFVTTVTHYLPVEAHSDADSVQLKLVAAPPR